ncbi:uncharacterized protein AB675_6405 [Cyphellophora attinorum]|uniref:Transcription activator AMTR1 n=1 Tax=Cyphellophora attinorum TaxID=1664694 RepID=A0A0N1HET8_9EURO|nr:uncharacterized protein AB675_6405 [Phialophora attinorum]KPI44047.1 hypothetical protein AB675_6405 [Phialophora attinorum]
MFSEDSVSYQPPHDCAYDSSGYGNTSPDARYLELQQELYSMLLAEVHRPDDDQDAEPIHSSELVTNDAEIADYPPCEPDFGRTSVPRVRMLRYLTHWITDSAPCLDQFDEAQHFGVQIPMLARQTPTLLYAILAFSARHWERKNPGEVPRDSLELYQESIRLLGAELDARSSNTVASVCILACFELMSDSSLDWRRHLEGCAALLRLYEVHGFSGGLLQAVFWCYARMDMCGAVLNYGREKTILPIDQWLAPKMVATIPPAQRDVLIHGLFQKKCANNPDMYGNWAVYLCAKAIELSYHQGNLRDVERSDREDALPLRRRWQQLWDNLQLWYSQRPDCMQPVSCPSADEGGLFPQIIFVHRAAIYSNQSYHAACIIMLELQWTNIDVLHPKSSLESVIWHARRVWGISLTNPHRGNLVAAVQPLCLAARYFTHIEEHLAMARLFKLIHETTGWGALPRIGALESFWGYDTGELSSAIGIL